MPLESLFHLHLILVRQTGGDVATWIRRASRREVEELAGAVLSYGEWYNSERLKSFSKEGLRGRPSFETIDRCRRRPGLPA